APGTYKVYAVGQASGASTSASFKIIGPSITITPTSGARGSTATITGKGYAANEGVTVKWKCGTRTCTSTTVRGTTTTDANGSFSLSVTIPTTATVGTTYSIG